MQVVKDDLSIQRSPSPLCGLVGAGGVQMFVAQCDFDNRCLVLGGAGAGAGFAQSCCFEPLSYSFSSPGSVLE